MIHIFVMRLDALDEHGATYISRDPSRDGFVQATLTIERQAYEESGRLADMQIEMKEMTR